MMALAAAAMVFSTLAYALAGGLSSVVVESTPPGARVIVGGQVIGKTPTTLKLPAGEKVRIKVEKKGFKPRSFSVTPAEGKAKRVKIKLKAR
jgi:hypothetical protein